MTSNGYKLLNEGHKREILETKLRELEANHFAATQQLEVGKKLGHAGLINEATAAIEDLDKLISAYGGLLDVVAVV